MIRIDEIYTTTFWPRLRQLYRIFSCDPFGRSDAASVVNLSASTAQDYVFFFDQEPIDLDLHGKTFDRVARDNLDLAVKSLYGPGEGIVNDPEVIWTLEDRAVLEAYRAAASPRAVVLADLFDRHPEIFQRFKQLNQDRFFAKGHVVTSERDSQQVKHVCQLYGWQEHYYWFHGWAALDWYRGYNRTYLMPTQRTIKKTFIMPNRIVGGARQHRLKMLYWIFKLNLMNNYISCPQICPAENQTVKELLLSGVPMMPDAVEVFDRVKLPLNMPGEQGHPMHSCWLSLFDESAECLLYLVTETVATGSRLHLTEKIFKPICLRMPFIVVGTCGSLDYLRSYGFQTFATLWDESYDTVQDDDDRIAAIAVVLADLDSKSLEQKQQLSAAAAAIVEHNYHHFYSGAFEDILWQELQSMLAEF